ncbi:MAG: hypothetical protein K5840_02960 [Eubacterium sp.]|nr:hypothetical protein [Eubacterium sp.]
MKTKKIIFASMLAAAMMFGLAACGSTESSDTSSDASSDAETVTMTDASGNAVEITSTEEFGISGNYVCGSDGSKWVFDSDTSVLAVAYEDESTGEVGCYLCNLKMYATAADEDGNQRLVVLINNLSTGDSSYWYVTNLVNEDEDGEQEIIGIELVKPGDEETILYLLTEEYYATVQEAQDSSEE